MNCPNCGTSNLDNATLCIHCGRPLTAGSGGGTYTVPPAPPLEPPGSSYTPPPPSPPPSSPQGGYTPPPPPPYSPAGGGMGGRPVPNYLVQSVLVTLCCCLPLGIVAIVFAAQVNSKLAAGDMAGAVEASRKAKMFCWLAFGIGLVVTILMFAFQGAMIMEAVRQGQMG